MISNHKNSNFINLLEAEQLDLQKLLKVCPFSFDCSEFFLEHKKSLSESGIYIQW